MLKRKYARGVMVFASRDWPYPDIIEVALQEITGYSEQETAVTIMHTGVCPVVSRIVREHGFVNEVCKPKGKTQKAIEEANARVATSQGGQFALIFNNNGTTLSAEKYLVAANIPYRVFSVHEGGK